jgi:hypothetical protein
VTVSSKAGIVLGKPGGEMPGAGPVAVPVEATVPEPPANPLAPLEETLPDAGALESPQFEKSAFGCGPNMAPAVTSLALPDDGPPPAGSTFPGAPTETVDEDPYGDRHSVRATELAIASAAPSASRWRKDRTSDKRKPRTLSEAMFTPEKAKHVPRRRSIRASYWPERKPEKLTRSGLA